MGKDIRQDPNLKFEESKPPNGHSGLSSPRPVRALRPLIAIPLVAVLCLVTFAALTIVTEPSQVVGQESAEQMEAPAEPLRDVKEMSLEELQSEFDEKIKILRTSIKQLDRSAALHFFSDSSAAYEHRENWEAAVKTSAAVYDRLQEICFAIFLKSDSPDNDLKNIVRSMSGSLYEEGRLGICYRITKKLLDLDPDDVQLKSDLSRSAIFNNEFGLAAKYASPSAIAKFPEIEQVLFDQLDFLKERKAYELKMREKDAKAKEPLPQVKFVIRNKGEFVMELYEDEAPGHVGNFISLVDAGFYDKMVFHRVMKHVLCEAGAGTWEGLRSAGYSIHNEADNEERRYHLRGSVGMSLETEKVSSASMFYITKIPVPGLDPTHTVFGRVISGMDIVDSLNTTIEINEEKEEVRVDGALPDIIESATVIRRRTHGKYEPNRVE